MEEDVIERRVQMRRIFFILTIPQVVAKKVGSATARVSGSRSGTGIS